MFAARYGSMRLNGFVDHFTAGVVLGWANDGDGEAVDIAIMLGTEQIGAGRTDLFRGDLGRYAGYRIELAVPVEAGDFLSGRVRAEAVAADGRRVTLPLSQTATFVDAALTSHLRTMSGVHFREMIGRILLARDLADKTPAAIDPRAAGDAVSRFSLPVGTLSPDAEVIVGYDDHMFVVTGSNGLIGQYAPSAEAEALSDGWLSLFERRREALRHRNVGYMQLMIPEKASVLADKLPFVVEPPTTLYRALAAKLAASPAADAFVDLYASFAALPEPDRESMYLKVDTHLSCRGAHHLFGLMLETLGVSLPALPFTERRRLSDPDLAHHFPWIGFVDEDLVPPASSFPIDQETFACVSDERTARHHGTRMVFRNPGAPIRKRVVAFANSFFTYGTNMHDLSWWMMRWFEEYHFVWLSEVDLDYVDRVKPDLVIAQTIERFLPILPDA